MKVYNLRCAHDHRFEGWFSSEADFGMQLERRLIDCPVCESKDIARMPSAPRLNLSGPQEDGNDGVQTVQRQLLEMVREVIEATEDVGDRFADEARRIHYREHPARNIRGVATLEERQALAEEGIDVVSLPLPAIFKRPLQ